MPGDFDGTNIDAQVVENVNKEIKALGDNVEKNYEELKNAHKKLQDVVGKGIDGNKEQIVKLQSDIITRQEAIDAKIAEREKLEKEFTERMDAFEVALKRPPKSNIDMNNPEQLKELKDWIADCKAATNDGKYKKMSDEELQQKSNELKEYKSAFEDYIRKGEKIITPEQSKTLSVGVDPHGGYTVTPAMGNKIITRLYESDPIRVLAAVETISTESIEWMVDWDEAGCGWETETAHGSEGSTPDMAKKKIVTHIMYAEPQVTQQLLEDSGINIESWLANKVADKFARTEAAAFVTGDGIGKPTGFLTYSNGTTYGTIEQVNMGAAAAITADGFISIKYALKEYYLNRGTWLMNRTSVLAAMLLKNGIGDYIWKPGLQGDSNATICGLPVRMSTTMPAIAANSLSVVLADWKEAYMIVDRLGITTLRDPYTNKPFIKFYTRKRVGGDVVNYEAIKIGKISA